jgi:hypothetical protein
MSAELASLFVSAFPDDPHALVFLANPLCPWINTYDACSNLPTAGLDMLPEPSDMFGGPDNMNAGLQNSLWA